jgi:chitinase
MGSAANRTAFVHAVLGIVETYELDGIDFEYANTIFIMKYISSFLYSWEYLGKQGIGCNTILSNDSANFLSFLQELRAHLAGQKLTILAAVYITPFAGSDGNPMTDVSDFVKVLDYIGEISPTICPISITDSHFL